MPEIGETVLTEATLIGQIGSPGFDMRPPELWQGEAITPEGGLRIMTDLWARRKFPPSRVEFHLLKNVYLTHEGLVFDAELNVVRATITQHAPAQIAATHARLAAAPDDVPVLPGRYVLCKKRGVENYGHWLIEMLPRAFWAREVLPGPWRYIVPRVEGPMAKVIAVSLACLGFTPDQLLPLDSTQVRVEELVVVTGLASHGTFMSPLVMGCLDALTAEVAPVRQPPLYVTRESSKFRNFSDPAGVRAFARRHGFAVIDPAKASFLRQIARFQGTRLIVGVMGAGMTNIAFAPPGSTVVVCAPASMPDTFFWVLSGLRGHRYIELRCPERHNGPARAPWDADIVVTPAQLARIFDPELAESGLVDS